VYKILPDGWVDLAHHVAEGAASGQRRDRNNNIWIGTINIARRYWP
jgi:hypothetical protein